MGLTAGHYSACHRQFKFNTRVFYFPTVNLSSTPGIASGLKNTTKLRVISGANRRHYSANVCKNTNKYPPALPGWGFNTSPDTQPE